MDKVFILDQILHSIPCDFHQIRSTSESAEHDRSLSVHSQQILRDELSQHKQSLIEIQRREVSVRLMLFLVVSNCNLS